MKFAFIGMSGTGKSYWSNKLKDYGYRVIGCDYQIGLKLRHELNRRSDHSITDIAHWMGQPFEDQYIKHSEKYLLYENMVMEEMLHDVSNSPHDENIVVDSTGSIIYVSERILRMVKQQLILVYLKPPNSFVNKMIQLYFDDPKPIIWGNFFTQRQNETPNESIRRCYPRMLEYRSKLYASLADITINTEIFETPEFSAKKLINRIASEIQRSKSDCSNIV